MKLFVRGVARFVKFPVCKCIGHATATVVLVPLLVLLVPVVMKLPVHVAALLLGALTTR